jgi:RNA recognition motif-containing protein
MDIAVYDRIRGGYRVFIGDLGPRIGKYELEKEFKQYGPITDTWVARYEFIHIVFYSLVRPLKYSNQIHIKINNKD